jgi:hypothetical protein
MGYYIVETTSNEDWEINHGYHLVKSDGEDQARDIVNSEVKQQILSVHEIKEFLNGDKIEYPISWHHKKGVMRTIIEAQVM